MIEVSKDDFYHAIGGPENIHPRSERNRSVWEDQRTHTCVGESTPGYMHPHGEPSRYFLTPEFADRKGIKELQ